MAYIMPILLLLSNWSVTVMSEQTNAQSSAVQVPKLFQEASSSSSSDMSAQSANGIPLKTLLTDSGELTYMSKRRSGFLPSRGKKDVDTFGVDAEDQYPFDDQAARLAFLMDTAKRASGFLPMRGRKSSAEMADTSELMEKRRVQSAFMPMRGRKWSGQPEAETANAWYPRFYHPVPFGAQMAKLGEPSPLILASNFRDEQEASNQEKRKGMGFFGARGKRSTA